MASSFVSSPVELCCKGVLFDMDGILISSLGSVERSWTKWAQLRGVDPEDAIHIVHGRRAIDMLIALRPDLDGEEELRILEDFEVEDTGGLVVLPGVCDLIDSLGGDRWTVVTSATERLARIRMAAGGIPVPPKLVTAEAVKAGKPDPAPYLAGAALLGFDPRQCVVFEDAASGVAAGRAAGCTVIATTFSHAPESLQAAHYLIRDLTGVQVDHLPELDSLRLRFTPLS